MIVLEIISLRVISNGLSSYEQKEQLDQKKQANCRCTLHARAANSVNIAAVQDDRFSFCFIGPFLPIYLPIGAR